MSSACRTAVRIGRRSFATRPNPIIDHASVSASSSSTRQFHRPASRFASVMSSMETMLPLHSTIAVARLKSNIAIDSTCWSLLSQEFALPR